MIIRSIRVSIKIKGNNTYRYGHNVGIEIEVGTKEGNAVGM